MKSKILTPVLAVALLLGATTAPRPALARDLAKQTAAVALALADEEPPLTRSQIIEKQKQEAAAVDAVEKKKESDTTPYYKKWWFWALTTAVVGGTVALGVWAVDTSTPPAHACSPGVIACFGDGRMEVK
jgi:hypothetical protein